MRYLKAAVVAFAGGVLLTAAMLAIEVAHAQRSVAAQIANCQTYLASDRSTTVCDSAVQVGGMEELVAFALGYAVAFAWFLRAHRRPIQ